ncbi:MAG: hypothetical protein HYV63_31050 [Candidatus Schekmanbacteria bacterium]|nr:hypothetical protein [Candidatus Schekmanbacteria bacterium]
MSWRQRTISTVIAAIIIYSSVAAAGPRPPEPIRGLSFGMGAVAVADDIAGYTNWKNNPYADIYVRGGPLGFGVGLLGWTPGRVSGDWIRGIQCRIVGPAGETVPLGEWFRWTTPAVAESYQMPPDKPHFWGLVPLDILRQLPAGRLEVICTAEWDGREVTDLPESAHFARLVEPDTPVHRAIYYYQWAYIVNGQATDAERPKAKEEAWRLMQGAIRENVSLPCIWEWAAAMARDTGRNRRAAALFTRYHHELTAAVDRQDPGYRPEDTTSVDPRERLKEARADIMKQIAHLRSLPDED